MKQLQLTAVHGKGFDHEIVDEKTGAHVAKVFAWESDSFELARLLAASMAMLNVLNDIARVYADFTGLEPNYPGWMDDVKDVIAQADGKPLQKKKKWDVQGLLPRL